MKKIIFLTGLFPKETRNEIENNSIGVIQYAADVLQWSIISGFDKLCKNNFKIINLLYIGSFPKRYKQMKINTYSFSHTENASDINVGFINLPLFKLVSRYYNAKKELKRNVKNDEEVILIYSVHTPFVKAAVDLKNRNPSIKICLIVPDLPEFMSDSTNPIYKLFKNIEIKILKSLLSKVDAFVLLSDYMWKPLNIGERPWVRVEGISNSYRNIENILKESFKTILYTGTLAKRYGIINLLDAFSMIKDDNYRLWICGDGDAKEELILRAKNDSRITNFGQINRDEVLKLQKRATVLVNPRTSEGEFTKYSFPSKTMEYLASGTPCIMHRLAAIPSEYFPFLFIADTEDSEGLKAKIVEVCNMEKQNLIDFGEKASDFILKNKNPQSQVKKIFDMINKL